MEKSRIQITRQDQGETLSTSKNKDGQESALSKTEISEALLYPLTCCSPNFTTLGNFLSLTFPIAGHYALTY